MGRRLDGWEWIRRDTMRKSVPAVAVFFAAAAVSYSIVAGGANADELVSGLPALHQERI